MESTDLSLRVHAEAVSRRVRRMTSMEHALRNLVDIMSELEQRLHDVRAAGEMDRLLPRFVRPASAEIQQLVLDTVATVRERAERGVAPHPTTTAEELIILLAAGGRGDEVRDSALTELFEDLLVDEELGEFFDAGELPRRSLTRTLTHLEPENWGRPFSEILR